MVTNVPTQNTDKKKSPATYRFILDQKRAIKDPEDIADTVRHGCFVCFTIYPMAAMDSYRAVLLGHSRIPYK